MARPGNALPSEAAEQIADYFAATYRALGAIPSQQTLVMERFFDESGGMNSSCIRHLAIESIAPGTRAAKRFCRSSISSCKQRPPMMRS